MESFITLLNNGILLIGLCFVYEHFFRKTAKVGHLRDVVTGILVGLIAVAVMLNPWSLSPGVFFDARWVILSLCGLFFGFTPTMIAVLIAGSFRVYQGGAGAVPGTAVIVTTAATGLFFGWLTQRSRIKISWVHLYVFGISVQFVMLSCMFFFPPDVRYKVIKTIAPPILIILPIITVLTGIVILNQEQRFKDKQELIESRKRLAKSNALLEGMANLVPGFLYQFQVFPDGSSKMPYVSPGIEPIYELTIEELNGDPGPIYQRIHAEDFERIARRIQECTKTLTDFEETFRVVLPKRGMEWRWCLANPSKLDDGSTLWNGVVLDITKRKHAEDEKDQLRQQLQQAQKVESIGRLAGGVAHDFNNMLGVILGYCDYLIEETEDDSAQMESLAEIKKAALRSAAITKQLLTFARKQVVTPTILDLNEAVEGMLKMLRRLIGEDIDLVWHPHTGINQVFIDPSQIDQILANLATNARDAIKGVGKVTVETNQIDIDEGYRKDYPALTPGTYVILSFSDSGIGIAEEQLQNIFEPFFTTKEVGKGTGLGLATIYGIMKQNGGTILVSSEPGGGTTFNLYFPAHDGQNQKCKEVQSDGTDLHGTETILIVEDEYAILKLGAKILENYGYKVITANKPSEAIAKASDYNAKIHLMITDVVMPDMSGKELTAYFEEARPEMKCLYVSGYTANAIVNRGILEEGVTFLAKPFSSIELGTKVREILDTQNGSGV